MWLGIFEVMKSEESECEVLFIAEAIGHTFKGFDFVVDTLYRASGYRFVVISQDASAVGVDGIGEFGQLGDFCRRG